MDFEQNWPPKLIVIWENQGFISMCNMSLECFLQTEFDIVYLWRIIISNLIKLSNLKILPSSHIWWRHSLVTLLDLQINKLPEWWIRILVTVKHIVCWYDDKTYPNTKSSVVNYVMVTKAKNCKIQLRVGCPYKMSWWHSRRNSNWLTFEEL